MAPLLALLPNGQLLLYAAAAIVALVVLIAAFRLNPFVVLVLVSLGMGLAAGMSLPDIVKAFDMGRLAAAKLIPVKVPDELDTGMVTRVNLHLIVRDSTQPPTP